MECRNYVACLLFGLMLTAVIGCAAKQHKRSGFLGDYSKLKADPQQKGRLA